MTISDLGRQILYSLTTFETALVNAVDHVLEKLIVPGFGIVKGFGPLWVEIHGAKKSIWQLVVDFFEHLCFQAVDDFVL